MIEKFNFYDLYAYFLPGVILLALIAGPFALVVPFSLSFQSGVFALVISYVFGHLVQNIARVLFPSKIRKGSKERLPSQILLDKDDKSLSGELKALLGGLIAKEFGLQVIAKESENDVKMDDIRDDAFRVCRIVPPPRIKKKLCGTVSGNVCFVSGCLHSVSSRAPRLCFHHRLRGAYLWNCADTYICGSLVMPFLVGSKPISFGHSAENRKT